MWSRDHEAEILPTCRELGIGFVPYSPLGRGFLSGRFTSPDDLDPGDFRRNGPRFNGDNLEANQALASKVAEIAAELHITAAQFALAWVLAHRERHRAHPRHQAAHVPRAERRRRGYSPRAGDAGAHRGRIAQAVGDRYDPAGMATLNR